MTAAVAVLVRDMPTLALMRRLDELCAAHPFLGSGLAADDRDAAARGRTIGRKRVPRLMRRMGIDVNRLAARIAGRCPRGRAFRREALSSGWIAVGALQKEKP